MRPSSVHRGTEFRSRRGRVLFTAGMNVIAWTTLATWKTMHLFRLQWIYQKLVERFSVHCETESRSRRGRFLDYELRVEDFR